MEPSEDDFDAGAFADSMIEKHLPSKYRGRIRTAYEKGRAAGMTPASVLELLSSSCHGMGARDGRFNDFAGRLAMEAIHRSTPATFSACVEACASEGLLAPALVARVRAHSARLDAAIVPERDFGYSILAVRTLEKSYLLRAGSRAILERPQHLFLRVALGIHGEDLDAALATYEGLSTGAYVHATPTLFNAGTPHPQMASCFLMTMKEDSIHGIFSTLRDCAMISKSAGGIGLAMHDIRALNTPIRGTNGTSNGLVPMCRVFNETARYVDQGGGKRKGSFALYLEPWHADIESFLQLKLNHGNEELRARDLFYGLWIPDLFMRRVEAGEPWSLLCPHQCPGLADVHGAAFERLYLDYEARGMARRTLPATELWNQIIRARVETGVPYLCFKDACNAFSNQQHLGTIRNSNLCTEIVQYTSPAETSVCNLASLALPHFFREDGFDHQGLGEATRQLVRNLNRVIDGSMYPIEEARVSNLRHRPIGIGVQGLHNVFMRMGVAYDSEAAREANLRIFETIYYHALDESAALAAADGAHASFEGSPFSEGRLQFDLRGNYAPGAVGAAARFVMADGWSREVAYDWDALRARVKRGTRNSLLTCTMPTASTASILGNVEGTEPISENLMTRRVLAGEYMCLNRELQEALEARGLWSTDVSPGSFMEQFMNASGRLSLVDGAPDDLRAVFKTAFELKQRSLLTLVADRELFIDQAQSTNAWADSSQPKQTEKIAHSVAMFAWKSKIKTLYYLRTGRAKDPVNLTTSMASQLAMETKRAAASDGECLACSA